MTSPAAERRERWSGYTRRQRQAAIELDRRRRQRAAGRRDTRDPLAWAREHLGGAVPLDVGPHHRWLATRLGSKPAGVRAFAGAPRGSGKSTIATLIVVLVALVRRSHRFIVIIRATEGDAKKAVEGIKTAIETRPALVRRYPWLAIRRYADGELRLGGTIILARGSGQAIRGLNRELGSAIVRPDLVIGDDLETDESARSKLLTGRLEDWLLGTVAQLGGPPGDTATQPLDLLVIGTTLSTSSMATRALDNLDRFAGWDVARFPAEAKVERSSTGQLVVMGNGKRTAIEVPAGAVEGDRVVLWPAGMPSSYLDALQDKSSPLFIGSRLYAQEYLLAPRALESTLFKAALTLWSPTLPGPRELERLAIGVDPAASKKETADYSALVATGLWHPGQTPSPRPDANVPPALAVLYGARRRVSLHELLGWIVEVWEMLDGRATIVFEANGAFAWGAQELRRIHRLPVRPVVAASDKVTRAQPLTVWHEAGRLHLAERLRGSDLDDELHDFTGTNADTHDDTVDALVWSATYATNGWRRR